MRRNHRAFSEKEVVQGAEQSREVQLSLYCTSWGLEASKQDQQEAA
jgi:hypothetical protein